MFFWHKIMPYCFPCERGHEEGVYTHQREPHTEWRSNEHRGCHRGEAVGCFFGRDFWCRHHSLDVPCGCIHAAVLCTRPHDSLFFPGRECGRFDLPTLCPYAKKLVASPRLSTSLRRHSSRASRHACIQASAASTFIVHTSRCECSRYLLLRPVR